MKFTKLDLLTLLIGLFLFSSCENTNTIGIEPEGDQAIKGDKATIAVNSVTEEEEITSTIAASKYSLGYISNDDTFGTTESSMVFSVSLPNQSSYSFGKTPVVDSAILTLPYTTDFYGDTTTSVYSFNVEQLQQDLSLQTSFLSNKEWPVQRNVGTFEGKISPKTPVRITEVVTDGPDTVKTIVPQLRIKLDREFIQNNIADLDSVSRSTNNKFGGKLKGLKVSVNKAKSTGKGGIMFFNLNSAGLTSTEVGNIEIYYKKQNISSSDKKDTVAVKFPIDSRFKPVATTIKHDYTGTPVKTQIDVKNPTTPYQVTYLHALGGLRNRITFPELASFITTAKNGNPNAKIVVNRAELVVNVNTGTDVVPFIPAQRLSLYRLDVGGSRANVPDNSAPTNTGAGDARYAGSDAAFGGFYDTTNKRYIFTLTAYIQDLIDGKTQNYGTFLAPSTLTEFNITPAYSSATRTVLNTATPKAGEEARALRLNIYYTLIN